MNQVVHVEEHSVGSPTAVFALLADVTTWTRWAAFDESGLEREGSPAPNGVGAVRRFRLGRTRSREEVVVFEPDRHLAYTVLSGVPVKGYRADVTLAPCADGGTDITWHAEFRPALPGLGGVIRRRLGAFITQTAAQLAAAAEQPTRVGG